jgi:hypothetical protein
MRRGGEEGAVLLMVLVALALLAALAGLVLRVSQSDLAGLAGERAAFAREDVIQSALATLGARLPADDLPQDGTAFSLPLPGGSVTLRLYAAQGLINPNFTRAPALTAALAALGATPAQAERLTLALVRPRGAANTLTFRSLSQVKALFQRDAELWPKVAPYLTLLGQSATIDPVQAPLALRNIAAPQGAEGVNFSDTGQAGATGFYEIWLHVDDAALDADDPDGRLWVHVSALAGRDHRLHIVARDWPMTRDEEG